MNILSSWTQPCTRCGGERRMVRAQHELGHEDDYCTKWCRCPAYLIVTVGNMTLGLTVEHDVDALDEREREGWGLPPKIDPEGAE